MKGYILTMPRWENKEEAQLWELLQFFLNNDIKKWIVAKETGTFGYKHFQIRMEARWNFEQMKKIFPDCHIEETDNWNDYERKEGNFYCWNDNLRQLQQRFGTKNKWQEFFVDILSEQNDRQVMVVVDRKGSSGKSWITGHLYETGKAFPCPATIDTVKGLIQFIANGYNNEEMIIIDIPRSWHWTQELAVLMETIKTGIIYDSRYKTTIRNISTKLVVFTNEYPNLIDLKLSRDRWKIFELNDNYLEYQDFDKVYEKQKTEKEKKKKAKKEKQQKVKQVREPYS